MLRRLYGMVKEPLKILLILAMMFGAVARTALCEQGMQDGRPTVKGSPEFRAQVRAAEDLLRERHPDAYERYLGVLSRCKPALGRGALVFHASGDDEGLTEGNGVRLAFAIRPHFGGMGGTRCGIGVSWGGAFREGVDREHQLQHLAAILVHESTHLAWPPDDAPKLKPKFEAGFLDGLYDLTARLEADVYAKIIVSVRENHELPDAEVYAEAVGMVRESRKRLWQGVRLDLLPEALREECWARHEELDAYVAVGGYELGRTADFASFLAMPECRSALGLAQYRNPPEPPPIPPPEPPLCDPAYPDVCIKPPPPDLDCGEIPHKNFRVLPPDPHRFDRDKDGIGCER